MVVQIDMTQQFHVNCHTNVTFNTLVSMLKQKLNILHFILFYDFLTFYILFNKKVIKNNLVEIHT